MNDRLATLTDLFAVMREIEKTPPPEPPSGWQWSEWQMSTDFALIRKLWHHDMQTRIVKIYVASVSAAAMSHDVRIALNIAEISQRHAISRAR